MCRDQSCPRGRGRGRTVAKHLEKSFSSWTWFALRTSPLEQTTWGEPSVGTPRMREVTIPSFRSWGSSEWGAGVSSVRLIGPATSSAPVRGTGGRQRTSGELKGLESLVARSGKVCSLERVKPLDHDRGLLVGEEESDVAFQHLHACQSQSREGETNVGNFVDSNTTLILPGRAERFAHDGVSAQEHATRCSARARRLKIATDRLPFQLVRTSWRILLRMCSTSKIQRKANSSACARTESMSSALCALPFLSVCVRDTTVERSVRQRGGQRGHVLDRGMMKELRDFFAGLTVKSVHSVASSPP